VQTFGEYAEPKGSTTCAHNPKITSNIEENTKYIFQRDLHKEPSQK
jgi:hypothetical protein